MSKPALPAHLMLAEMALKRAQKSVRGKVRKNVGRAASDMADKGSGESKSRTLGQAAVLYGVSRLATRSVPGALLEGGGYLAKTLLEKRKAAAEHDSEE
ncbi:MAG: hypothetical protein ABJP34_05710 [Erythrobacter sp.]